METRLNESREMYLESILRLLKQKDELKAVDLARVMGYSRPSVSRALLILENDGLISRDKKDNISLTPEGMRMAGEVLDRHNVLTSFFIKLGVDASVAEEDACRIEHIISPPSFEAIKAFLSG